MSAFFFEQPGHPALYQRSTLQVQLDKIDQLDLLALTRDDEDPTSQWLQAAKNRIALFGQSPAPRCETSGAVSPSKLMLPPVKDEPYVEDEPVKSKKTTPEPSPTKDKDKARRPPTRGGKGDNGKQPNRNRGQHTVVYRLPQEAGGDAVPQNAEPDRASSEQGKKGGRTGELRPPSASSTRSHASNSKSPGSKKRSNKKAKRKPSMGNKGSTKDKDKDSAKDKVQRPRLSSFNSVFGDHRLTAVCRLSAKARPPAAAAYIAPPHLRLVVPGARSTFSSLDSLSSVWGIAEGRRRLRAGHGLEFLEPPSPLARFAWLSTPSHECAAGQPCAACAFQAPLFAEVVSLGKLTREASELHSVSSVGRNLGNLLSGLSLMGAKAGPHSHSHPAEPADAHPGQSQSASEAEDTSTEDDSKSATDAESDAGAAAPIAVDPLASAQLEMLLAYAQEQLQALASMAGDPGRSVARPGWGASAAEAPAKKKEATRADKVNLRSLARKESHSVVVPSENMIKTKACRGRRLKEEVAPFSARMPPSASPSVACSTAAGTDDEDDTASESGGHAGGTLESAAKPGRIKTPQPGRKGAAAAAAAATELAESGGGDAVSLDEEGKRSLQPSIEFTLDGALAADSGWTLQSVDDPNVFDPALQTYRDWASGRGSMYRCAKVIKKGRRAGEPKDRRRREFYGLAERSQTKFFTLINETGTIHWPSGRKAICISSCKAGLYTWAFRDSPDPETSLQFYCTPYGDGCLLWPDGSPRVLFNQQSLSLWSQNGDQDAAWRWDSIPFIMPLEIQAGLKVRISSSKEIILDLAVQAQSFKIAASAPRNWLRAMGSRPLSTAEMTAKVYCASVTQEFDALETELYDTLCKMWETFMARAAARSKAAEAAANAKVASEVGAGRASGARAKTEGRRHSSLAYPVSTGRGSVAVAAMLDVGRTLKKARVRSASKSRKEKAPFATPGYSTQVSPSKVTRYELARLISHAVGPTPGKGGGPASPAGQNSTLGPRAFASTPLDAAGRPHTAPSALGLDGTLGFSAAPAPRTRRANPVVFTDLWDPKHIPVVTDQQLLALLNQVPAEVMVIVLVSNPLARRAHQYDDVLRSFHKQNCAKHVYRSGIGISSGCLVVKSLVPTTLSKASFNTMTATAKFPAAMPLKPPLLVERHNARPGMVLFYSAQGLVFAKLGSTVRDKDKEFGMALKQAETNLRAAKFLPGDFKLTAAA